MNRVIVLLSTYNGENYLDKLLESVFAQQHVDVFVLARDDGSSDLTTDILQKYKRCGKLDWYQGDNLKPARSFWDLIEKAPEADYYAFCDQDDIWLPDKLDVAIERLSGNAADKPCLYYGHPRVVDKELNPILNNSTTQIIKAETFCARLVVRNAIGCTFVFNRALIKEARKYSPDYLEMHDIWLFQICNVLDGTFTYDEDVPILYRQHDNNAVGTSISPVKKIKGRLIRLFMQDGFRCKTANELLKCFKSIANENKIKELSILANYKKNLRNRIHILFSREYETTSQIMNRNFKISIILGIF